MLTKTIKNEINLKDLCTKKDETWICDFYKFQLSINSQFFKKFAGNLIRLETPMLLELICNIQYLDNQFDKRKN